MKLDEFIEKLFKSAEEYGFTGCEAYYGAGSSFRAMVRGGEVEEYKSAESGGLSFRGIYGGKMGYSYSEAIDGAIIPLLVKNAAENAGIIESAEAERLFKGSESYMELPEDTDGDEMDPARKIELAKRMEARALSADPRVKSVIHCLVSTGSGETRIMNTLGLSLSHASGYAYALILVQAEENSQVKVAGEYYIGHSLKGFDPEDLAEQAVKKAVSYLGASPVKNGKYPVVLNNLEAINLISSFAGVFYAEKVQKGFSLLKGKLGTTIASECVTLRDDGVYKDSLGNVPFDSEGVATKNKAVIENGVLKTYLYNLKTAEIDGVESTGNGFKPSFRNPVGTACANFYIVPSDTGLEELFKEMGDGLYITELAGLHSGTNAVSGSFSLSADGYLIENGKIARPVEQITVAGNFFDLLKDITAVGSDLRFDDPGGDGCFGMPSILIKELAVAGV